MILYIYNTDFEILQTLTYCKTPNFGGYIILVILAVWANNATL